jgi:catechol-2,3-dioxygenase
MAIPAETHVGRIGLAVADPDEVAAFYADVAGLQRVGAGDAGGTGSDAAADVALGVDGNPLVALRATTDLPPRPADAAGLLHAAVRYPTRRALAAGLPATVILGDRYRGTGQVELETRDGETTLVEPGAVPDALARFGPGG